MMHHDSLAFLSSPSPSQPPTFTQPSSCYARRMLLILSIKHYIAKLHPVRCLCSSKQATSPAPACYFRRHSTPPPSMAGVLLLLCGVGGLLFLVLLHQALLQQQPAQARPVSAINTYVMQQAPRCSCLPLPSLPRSLTCTSLVTGAWFLYSIVNSPLPCHQHDTPARQGRQLGRYPRFANPACLTSTGTSALHVLSPTSLPV